MTPEKHKKSENEAFLRTLGAFLRAYRSTGKTSSPFSDPPSQAVLPSPTPNPVPIFNPSRSERETAIPRKAETIESAIPTRVMNPERGGAAYQKPMPGVRLARSLQIPETIREGELSSDDETAYRGADQPNNKDRLDNGLDIVPEPASVQTNPDHEFQLEKSESVTAPMAREDLSTLSLGKRPSFLDLDISAFSNEAATRTRLNCRFCGTPISSRGICPMCGPCKL